MREGYHGERMIKALGVFMEGESSIREWPSFSSRGEQSPISDSSKQLDPVGLIHLANSRKKLDIPPPHIPQTELGIPLRGHPRPYRSRSPPRKAREGSLISEETYSVLHRASVLIRKALDVDGVVFLDISPFNRDRHGVSSDTSSNLRPHSRDVAQNQHSTGHVLGCSIDQGNDQDITIPTPLLRSLVLRYGRGGIFHYEEDRLTPLTDENLSDIDASSPVDGVSLNDLRDDMRQLSHIFSGSNSVAFFPLWDFQQTRWFAGCFTWTKNPRRVFTESKDLTYLAAFNNSVMAEVSRLDLRAADCEKADFISSVSHEWRTPLHGILNMLDILKETNITPVQRHLIDITTNCGKTLVDTVNHVLDYAKINSLIGPTAHDQPPEQPGASQDSHFDTPALINQVNMATLVEEVAEALLASQDYLGRNAEALFSAAEQTVDRPFRESNIPNTIPRAIFAIVDIEWRESWECCVSAGAWRRILLNLFGNALKFTPSGFVQLKLRHDTLKVGHENLPAILIQISDSGRGISPDFSSNLYTPFQQEDSLSPGIGVGLNIVYRIVDSMRGLIDLRSEPDRGTVASVILPITPAQRPSLIPLSFADLRKRLRGKTISLFPGSSKYGDLKIDPETFNAMLTSMKEMIAQWFGVRVLAPSDRVPEYADISIITEHEYRYAGADESAGMYDRTPRARKHPMTSFPIIVLCTHAHSWFKKPRDPREPVVFLQQPIAPRTLASALTRCLDQSTQSHDVEDKELAEAPSKPLDGTKQHSRESGKVNSVGYNNEEPRYNQDYGALDHRHLKQQFTVLLVEDNILNLKV
jgi:signal transduction histidine kinase